MEDFGKSPVNDPEITLRCLATRQQSNTAGNSAKIPTIKELIQCDTMNTANKLKHSPREHYTRHYKQTFTERTPQTPTTSQLNNPTMINQPNLTKKNYSQQSPEKTLPGRSLKQRKPQKIKERTFLYTRSLKWREPRGTLILKSGRFSLAVSVRSDHGQGL